MDFFTEHDDFTSPDIPVQQQLNVVCGLSLISLFLVISLIDNECLAFLKSCR